MKRFTKRIKIISYFVIIISLAITPLKAFAVDYGFYSANNIIFYDPGDTSASCTSTGSITEKIWSYFINKGLTKEQTAGIIGNLAQESDISPTAWQTKENNISYIKNSASDGHAWGIAQWDGTRRYSSSTASDGTISESGVIGALITNKPLLAKYLDSSYSSSGVIMSGSNDAGWTLTDATPLSSIDIPEADLNELLMFELDFIWQEFPDNGFDEFKTNSSTIVDAAVSFNKLYERSGDIDKYGLDWVKARRGGYGQAVYDKLKNISISTSSADCSTGNAFIDTVKKYVWPTFKGWYDKNGDSSTGTVAITPTADYQTAIAEANAAGRYTGDTCFAGGIDCGGFVTTLIHDSGWDTTYNYEALRSKGAGGTSVQIQWLNANWTNLGNAATIDTSTLQPGDVAIYTAGEDGHVFVYIGTVDGFDSVVASASQCQRAPMSGKESLVDSKYTWYRKK